MKNLEVKKLQALKGGQNSPSVILNPGCGPVFPNINGIINSVITPLVTNTGGNNGNACPLPFITPPSGG